MKTKLVILFVFLLNSLQSCSFNSKGSKKNKFVAELKKEIVLIKSIPGASRSHIIILKSKGILIYNVGSVSELRYFDHNSVCVDTSYSEKKIILKSEEILALNKIILLTEKMSYNDSTIVKDNMQYHMYYDGEKRLFGFEKNFSTYPKEWQDIVTFLFKKVKEFYKIPGMS